MGAGASVSEQHELEAFQAVREVRLLPTLIASHLGPTLNCVSRYLVV